MTKIIESAIEAIQQMSPADVEKMIVRCGANNKFANWEIRINSMGRIFSDSGMHETKDDEAVISHHGMGCTTEDLLEWFGLEEDAEEGWYLPISQEISTEEVITYLQGC